MLVEVVEVPLGGGGVDATPGESIIPASAEVANAAIRTATAHAWRILLNFLYLPKYTKTFV